jgi:hypothetical protein
MEPVLMICTKRQRVVKRDSNGSVESFRCLNKSCDLHSQVVSDELCEQCPLKVLKRKRRKEKLPLERAKPKEGCKGCNPPDMPKIVPPHANLALQIIAWKDAVLRWRKAGKPRRSDAEVKKIKEEFCCEGKCDWYEAKKGRCKGCGCRVTEGGVAVLNKIRMATEHCPRHLW